MANFIITLLISFSLLLFTALLISYCKRRQSRTQHGLTGMCHETGGSMCGCCSSKMLAAEVKKPRKSTHPAIPQ